MSAFRTDAILVVVDDHDYPPIWRLFQPLTYSSDVLGYLIEVPTGYQTDLASIPELLLTLAGGQVGHRAAIVHDYLITSKLVPRPKADDVLEEALRVCGVPHDTVTKYTMAVRLYTASQQPPNFHPQDNA